MRDAIDPDLLQTAARLALSSRHPLAVALAREASGAAPFEGAGRGAGAGRARRDRRRRGAPRQREFCGLHADAQRPCKPASHRRHLPSLRGWRAAIRAARSRIDRPEAAAGRRRDGRAALRELGLDLRILSGDRDEAVAPVAQALGIAHWQGGLKPAEKIAFSSSSRQRGRRVLMVGDGLNDAPSLAAAHVSLSPIAAADLTQAQADAVFLGERLAPVAEAVRIARRARGLMKRESVGGGGLQCHRGAGRHCRPGDAADRGARHVGFLDHGDVECVAGGARGPMKVLSI